MPGGVLVCEWPPGAAVLSAGRRVTFDPAAGTVTFEHCHRRRAFWAVWADAIYTCTAADVLAVHRDKWFNRGEDGDSNATIVTRHGAATVNSRMAGYEVLVSALEALPPAGGGSPWDNPNNWTLAIWLLCLALSGAGVWWATR